MGTFHRYTSSRLLYKLNSIMEPLPDMSSMDKKALESLVLDLYQRSCQAFGDTFDVQHVVKKHDIEIHELEMEVNDMNGKFVIPKLRKVKHLHVPSESED